MTQIKKVKTSEGVQFFPITHTKAVIDDNGYTAESRLQAMQDEINQAQLEVGAVPSDLTPTEDSTNWVTSGGVYNALQNIQTDVTELAVDIPLQKVLADYTANRWYQTNNGVAEVHTNVAGTYSIVIDVSSYTGYTATVTGKATTVARMWYLTDDNFNIISMSAAEMNGTDNVFIVDGATKLIAQTKDSSVVGVYIPLETSILSQRIRAAKIADESETTYSDFSLADANGNVLIECVGGHIQTKNFNSARVEQSGSMLSQVINKYNGKKLSILGDSISTFGSPSATNESGTYCYSYYPTATCRYSEDGVDSIQFNVNNTYWMQLIKATGMILGINESYRGSCVSGSGDTAFCSQTRINHLGENGTPDVILVYGGTNDAGNSVTLGTFNGGVYSDYDTASEIAALPVTTFADAYKAMLIRLMYTYPTAEIVVVLPTFTTSYYTIAQLDNYIEVIKEACDFFGIKWIDIRANKLTIFNKATYLSDGIHPNAAGMTLIFEKIYKHLIFD